MKHTIKQLRDAAYVHLEEWNYGLITRGEFYAKTGCALGKYWLFKYGCWLCKWEHFWGMFGFYGYVPVWKRNY